MSSSFDTASHTRVQPARAPRPAEDGSSGLDAKTLIITAIASGAAMLIVSQIWRPGTLLFAAVTPVLVSVIGEVLKKPKTAVVAVVPAVARPRPGEPAPFDPLNPEASEQATRVRRPGEDARAAGDPATAPDGRPRASAAGAPAGRRPRPSAPASAAGARSPTAARTTAAGRTPASARRWRIALITGLLGFAIAATAVTVPELVSGQAAGGDGDRTTLFGGSSDERDRDRDRERDREERRTVTESTEETAPQATVTETTPAAPSGGESAAPPAAAPEVQPEPAPEVEPEVEPEPTTPEATEPPAGSTPAP